MDVRAGPQKKAKRWRIYAFELWYWRRLLRVPWTARRSNQSILKEISAEYSLKGLMLKLKLQYFGHLMQRTDSVEKILMLGKIEGGRRRGQQRMKWWDGITDSMDMSFWVSSGSRWWTGMCCRPQDHKESDRTAELNWTELNSSLYVYTTFCLSILLSMDIGVASTFWLLWIIFKILLSINLVYIKKQLWHHVKINVKYVNIFYIDYILIYIFYIFS